MTGRHDWFIKLDDSSQGKIRFADDSSLNSEGSGRVVLRDSGGREVVIDGVLYVPGLKTNLISLGQLLQKGFMMEMKKNGLNVYDQSKKLVIHADLSENRTFRIAMITRKHQCLATAVNKDEWIWHNRFGHLNFQHLSNLQTKNMVKGLPPIKIPEEVCRECIQCKQSRPKFKEFIPTKATEKLGVIYSDVCGRMQVETPSGNRYILTFIDDLTRKMWIYLIKRKNEVFSVFKKFKSLVERQSGSKIKVLRSDGGGEYAAPEFSDFCEKEGIVHEFTPPYTPQHNGAAERRNRTLLNMVRCMLKTKKMPNFLWGEAANAATYVLNMSPTRRLKLMTPEEAWTSVKPDVSHLRIFGSMCYKHVPDALRRKLDDKSTPQVLIGYHETGGYKLYDPNTEHVSTSRDVYVDESSSWDWTVASTKATTYAPKIAFGEEESADKAITELAVRKSGRRSQLPSYLQDYDITHDVIVTSDGNLVHSALIAESEPITFEEAARDGHWWQAMEEEIDSIKRNNTWELVELPLNKKPIALKWIYKVKVNANGEIVRHKARLVAKGFLQKAGIDYGEVYAPVARIETVRLVVALATNKDWSLHQLDVKSAFLNGPLEEEVYVQQPIGFVQETDKHKVYKLNKALYGLKQAPRAWNKQIDQFFEGIGFMKCISEHGVYVKNAEGSRIIICLYVDDLLITGDSEKSIESCKAELMKEFEMNDLGKLSYFLGIEFTQTKSGVIMHQTKYTRDLLKKFNIEQSNPTTTPAETGMKLEHSPDEEGVNPAVYRSIVGSLRYLCNTRPDLSFSVGVVSRHMQDPKVTHLLAVKRIMRYLHGTEQFGVLLCRGNEELVGYSDADWCGDKTDRRSTAGYVFFLGRTPISWSSTKEPIVALSSCEAEYIAASEAACQAIWLGSLLRELGVNQRCKLRLLVDNQSAINLAKHPTSHGRSKHIETRFHFIREQVSKEKLVVEHCKSEVQFADILTKALKHTRFKFLRESIGVVDISNLVCI